MSHSMKTFCAQCSLTQEPKTSPPFQKRNSITPLTRHCKKCYFHLLLVSLAVTFQSISGILARSTASLSINLPLVKVLTGKLILRRQKSLRVKTETASRPGAPSSGRLLQEVCERLNSARNYTGWGASTSTASLSTSSARFMASLSKVTNETLQ